MGAAVVGLAGILPLALSAQHNDNHSADSHGGEHAMVPAVESAVAVMAPTAGNNVSGVVTFTATHGGVRVVAEISGLNPNSSHGFHIHQFGDLRSTDGKSLGGHFNPHGRDHNLPPRVIRHAGDLGNLKADGNGNARLAKTFSGITILGHESPILGRGVVIHAKPDDGGQPTGNAGARIAVGVIGAAK